MYGLVSPGELVFEAVPIPLSLPVETGFGAASTRRVSGLLFATIQSQFRREIPRRFFLAYITKIQLTPGQITKVIR